MRRMNITSLNPRDLICGISLRVGKMSILSILLVSRCWVRPRCCMRRRPARPGFQLVIIVECGAKGILSAKDHDAVIAHGCRIEPASVDLQVRSKAPGIAERVVDLREDCRRYTSK